MVISNSEHITRIGLFYSRATRVKAKMLLNIEHVIFINLYVSVKSKSIPLMVLFNFLKLYHDKVYIHLDIISQGKIENVNSVKKIKLGTNFII